MRRRGLVTVTAMVAVVAVGCTSDGEVAGELRDIREVLAEETDPEPPAQTGPEGGDEPDLQEGASAEAPEPAGSDKPVEVPEPDPDVDITQVPDEITLEYVQAVLDELERILFDALVMAMEEGELTLDIADHIGESFALRQRDIRLDEFKEAAEAGFPGMRELRDLEVRYRRVIEILDYSDRCIYVHTLTDDTPYFLEPVEPVDIFVLLERPTVERPVDINPTPWVYASIGGGDNEAMRELTPCSG